MKFPVRCALLLPACWLAACAHQHGENPLAKGAAASNEQASTEQNKGFRIKTGDMFDDDSAKIRAKFGAANQNIDPKLGVKKASGFSQEDKNFAGKTFDTKKYGGTKSFWGDKEYATKVYAGNTDGSRFMKESKIGEKSAREAGGQAAHDADRQFATHDYQGTSKTAREATKDAIGNKSYAEADVRRKTGNAFSDPVVTDWREQRKMTVEQTKGILGH